MKPAHKTLTALAVVAAVAAGWWWLGRADQGGQPTTVTTASPDGVETPVAGTTAADPTRVGPTVTDDEATNPDRVTVGIEAGDEFEQGVRGFVRDLHGAPVAGADVFLMTSGGRNLVESLLLARKGTIVPPVAVGTTDATGAFALGVRKPSANESYQVRAQHPQFADTEVNELRLREGEWFDTQIRMPKGARVYGRVTIEGTSGLPIPNATVYARPLQRGAAGLNPAPGREYGIETRADANGAYVFENMPQGLVTISAVAPGFARVDRANCPVTQQRDNKFDFALPQGKTITGIVMDTSGEPARNAHVVAISISKKSPSMAETRSDASGRFELQGLLDGPFQLKANAIGFIEAEVAPVLAGTQGQRILLERQLAAKLRVVTPAGQPVLNYQATVRHYFADHGTIGTMPFTANLRVTRRDLDDEGYFELSGLDPASYVIQIVAEGHAKTFSEPFTTAVGQPVPRLDVTLVEGGSLRGTIVDPQGRGVANAEVQTSANREVDSRLGALLGNVSPPRITIRTTHTDADGNYALSGLSPGEYMLRVDHPDFTHARIRDLQVEDQRETIAQTIRLSAGTQVQGIAYLDGRPAPAIIIKIDRAPDPESGHLAGPTYEALSSVDGRFVVHERFPPGDYSARAARQALGSPLLQVADFAKTVQNFTVAPGQVSATLEFRLQSEGQ